MTTSRIAIVLSLLCFAAGVAPPGKSAVRPPKISNGISGYHLELWNSELGLPQNTISALTQTKDGYLWVATELGLVRFDGLHFTIFDKSTSPELKNNKIVALTEDRNGTLWVGTAGGGVSSFRDDHFQTYTTRNGLSNDAVRCLLTTPSGELWIGTNDGLDVFSNGHIRAFTTADGLPDTQIFSLAQSADGAVWVGTHDGLARYSDGHFRTYKTAHGLANNFVRSLLAQGQTLWIGTDGGLSSFDGEKFRSITIRDGLLSNSILSLLADRNSNIWVGTLGGGLVRMTKYGQLNNLTMENGLPKNDISSLLQDSNGDLWVGTLGGGLVHLYNRTLFSTYDRSRGLSNSTVLGVMEDHEGTLWVGTGGGGLNRLRNGQFTAITAEDGLASDFIYSLAEARDGSLWIGTRKGLNRFKDGEFTRYTKKDGLPADAVIALLYDSRGILWIGTRAGLGMWKNGDFTTFTTKDGLSSNAVQSIYEDHQHRLWIGTGGAGLNLLENGHFRSFNTRDGLSNNVVFSIEEGQDGTIWIGTDGGGLNMFRNGKFYSFTTRDGMLDDAIFRILQDSSGALWMSSNRGVFRATIQSLYDYADKRTSRVPVLAYGTGDGMNTRECNGGFQPAGWKGKDGRLWFPTMDGVITVDPAKLTARHSQQHTILEQALINDRELSLLSKLEAPAGEGNLEFHYSAPNFRAAHRINFEYRLEGFDKDWVHAGQRRVAYYTNIPPGNYRFRVTASNEDGTWSTLPAEIALKLEPHFYQTVPFYLLCGLALAGLAVGAHRGRVGQLRERERELEQRVNERTVELRREIAERERAELESWKAREAAERANRVKSEFLANMSHEIRTPMNAILGMTRLALGTDLTSQQRQFLELSKDSADSLLTVIDDILDFSKVEAGKLDLNPIDFNLRTSLESAMNSLAFRADQKGILLVFSFADDTPEMVHADPVRLRQVILNLVGNAIKFTDQGEVRLDVRCQQQDTHGYLIGVTVSDTGIGIAQDKLGSIFDAFSQADSSTTRKFGGTGLGLAICHRLVHLMGGRIWATSELGLGSQFHFTVQVGIATAVTGDAADQHESSLVTLAGVCQGSRDILLAEDNPANRMVARFALQTAGFRVTEVDNGRDAVEAVKNRHFDLVLMDCRMPIMDGYGATQEIRRLSGTAGRVPIVALTASAFREDRERAHEAGMNDFIAKPFEDKELIEKCLLWTRTRAAEALAAGASRVDVGAKPSHDRFAKYSPDFLRGMLELFLESAPPVFENLMSSIREGDWAQAKSSAHWLRGGASRILGGDLQEQLERIEAQCNMEPPGVAKRDADLLAEAFQEACTTAEDWLSANRAYASAS